MTSTDIFNELQAEREELDALVAMYRIRERRLTLWSSYWSDVLDMVDSLEAMQERVLTGEERVLTGEERGLTEEEINLLPTRTFSSQGQEPGDATRGGEQEIEQCQICLLDMEDGDTLRCIPCIHHFHSHCLDEWVKRHATCPSCRQDLRPQRHD